MDFRKHSPDYAVIIDCFEIFIDIPPDLKARALSYNHYNTVKYLIEITTKGNEMFFIGRMKG